MAPFLALELENNKTLRSTRPDVEAILPLDEVSRNVVDAGNALTVDFENDHELFEFVDKGNLLPHP